MTEPAVVHWKCECKRTISLFPRKMPDSTGWDLKTYHRGKMLWSFKVYGGRANNKACANMILKQTSREIADAREHGEYGWERCKWEPK